MVTVLELLSRKNASPPAKIGEEDERPPLPPEPPEQAAKV